MAGVSTAFCAPRASGGTKQNALTKALRKLCLEKMD